MGRWLPDPDRRTTSELIVFMLTVVVGFGVSTLTLGTFVLAFIRPELDLAVMVRYLTDLFSIIVGALIGFVSGRFAGRSEKE